MPTAVERRLPGFRFEAVAPSVDEALPRMDVAVFAGFAASGPVGLPVAVEDAAQFESIFGKDAVLAWDGVRAAPVRAYLAPVVRAFFANGGVRAWIIRLARDTETNRFPIPGLFSVTADGSQAQAEAIARSPGSWSDSIETAATLTAEPLIAARYDTANDVLELTEFSARSLRAGDLLRVRFPSSALAALFVVDRDSPAVELALPANAVWTTADLEPAGPFGLSGPDELPAVERLTFSLWARRSGEPPLRLDGLGFAPKHPRYWRELPWDEQLFGKPAAEWSQLWIDCATPRFPLAADPSAEAFSAPLGMEILPANYAAAVAQTKSALERDGLAQFDSALFLDEELIEPRLTDLLNEAGYIRDLRAGKRKLRGIHAALDLEEATLIAVPDAAQTGWEYLGPSPAPPAKPSEPLNPEGGVAETFLDCGLRELAAPALQLAGPDTAENFTLNWTKEPGATVILEESSDPDPKFGAEVYRGSEPGLTIRGGRSPGHYYYRARQVAGNVTSDWSNTVVVTIQPASGSIALSESAYSPAALLDVHRALARLAAARGDLFAVLSLPKHYRENEAIEYAGWLGAAAGIDSALVGAVPQLQFNELLALSCVGLYHPWIITSDGAEGTRELPPDGAAAGVIARRSRLRGAWIAPANDRLAGVLALEPSLSEARFADLQTAQLNILRREPAGFMAMNADTQSQDADLRQINVRRLLHLLRRLALREGDWLVFEPNDETFRRLVARKFERLLGGMFSRGAFRGARPDLAFRVVVDDTVNPPQSVEQGRFIVELKVAPSLPMRFLTVRLVQTGERLVAAEVI